MDGDSEGGSREIVVVFREDAAARLASLGWFQRHAVPHREMLLSRILQTASVALMGGLVALGFILDRAVSLQAGLALATFLAVLFYFGWSHWNASLTRRVSTAFDAAAWGEVRYAFDPAGFSLDDNLRHWRTGWAGVAHLSAEPEGLFLATKGMVFYVPKAGWPDAATRAADAERIEAWWRAATGRTA